MKKESNKNIIVLATLFFIASIFVSVPFCKADTKKTLYADRDYIDLKIDDREAKYILDIESKNVGAVDWIGYVSRLDLKEFDSSSDFYERVKDNRTIYTTEGEPLGIVYGEAKSLFRYFDVLSNAIGWAVNRVFGNKIEDTVTIPSDEKNLYLVRVYSGGWGKMVDPNEKSLVREKVYKGDERDKQAMVLNIGTATLDTLGIFIPFTNFVSDDLGEIVAAGFIKASRFFFEPDIVRGVPDLKDLLQITVESGEAMLIKTAEIIKKESTQNFFKFVIKNSKQLVEIVDLPEKISKGGKVVDRITQMLTTATPLETSYVVVGNPLLALEKKEIPEIIEKGGPAALVPPSAVEEKPKEKVSEAQPQLSPSYQAEPLPNGITVENLSIALTKIERKQDYYDSKIDRVYLDFTLRKIKASGESNFNFSFELIDDHGNIYDENNFIHSSLCACSERTIGPTIGLIRTTYCMNSFAPKIDEAPIGFTWTVPLCPYEIPATASLTKVKIYYSKKEYDSWGWSKWSEKKELTTINLSTFKPVQIKDFHSHLKEENYISLPYEISKRKYFSAVMQKMKEKVIEGRDSIVIPIILKNTDYNSTRFNLGGIGIQALNGDIWWGYYSGPELPSAELSIEVPGLSEKTVELFVPKEKVFYAGSGGAKTILFRELPNRESKYFTILKVSPENFE